MDKQLSSETEAALKKLAREISRARGLGDEVQEELYGHLEDKTLGYLSGDEEISEADAVLLTWEHFGGVLTASSGCNSQNDRKRHMMFLPDDAKCAFPRRVLTAALLLTSLNAVWCALVLAGLVASSSRFGFSTYEPVRPPVLAVLLIAISALFGLTLSRLQRQIEMGHMPWPMRQSLLGLSLMFVALVFVTKLIPPTILAGWSTFPMTHATGWTRLLKPVNLGLIPAALIVQCMAWLWWCTRDDRRWASLVLAFAAWCCFGLLFALVPSFEFLAHGQPGSLASHQALGLGRYLFARGPSFPLYTGTATQATQSQFYIVLNVMAVLLPGLAAFTARSLFRLSPRARLVTR